MSYSEIYSAAVTGRKQGAGRTDARTAEPICCRPPRRHPRLRHPQSFHATYHALNVAHFGAVRNCAGPWTLGGLRKASELGTGLYNAVLLLCFAWNRRAYLRVAPNGFR